MRRLVDWINPTFARKDHSLIDRVYKRKNLEMAWEKVKANRGSGGRGRAESGRIGRATRSAVGSNAERTEGGCLAASTGAAGTDPEGGQTGRGSHVGNPDDL